MWSVLVEKNALKSLSKAPSEIRERFEKWKDIVHIQGPRGLLGVKGFRDHMLKGQWHGARASRLNEQWRVIYCVTPRETKVLVLELSPHDYRKKS